MVTEESSAALMNPSPPSLMATEMVGGLIGIVELFVTDVLLRDAASFP